MNKRLPSRARIIALLFASLSTGFLGCAVTTAGITSIVDPDYDPSSINKVAIFPIDNPWLSAPDADRLEHYFARELKRHRDDLVIVGPEEINSILGREGLSGKWNEFLKGFLKTGKPDTGSLRLLGSALGVDAFIKCDISYIMRRRGAFLDRPGLTYVTLHYFMFGSRQAKLLWEATCAGVALGNKFSSSPPSVFEVAYQDQWKVISSLPF